jgi:hypothetical protein
MPPTLLAERSIMLAKSPEDVASRALELLLRRSQVLRHAVTVLVDTWRGRPGPVIARVASEVGAADGARTDLQAFDPDHQLTVIFENKFWAGLRENQPNTYLERLAARDYVSNFPSPFGIGAGGEGSGASRGYETLDSC